MTPAALILATHGLPEGIVLVTRVGVVLALNDTAEAILAPAIAAPLKHIEQLFGTDFDAGSLAAYAQSTLYRPFYRHWQMVPQLANLRFSAKRFVHDTELDEPLLIVRIQNQSALENHFVRLNAILEQQRKSIAQLTAMKTLVERREQDLRLAVESVDDWAWDWDIGSGQMRFHTRRIECLGFEPGRQALHMSEWQSRVHKHDLGNLLGALQDYLSGACDSFHHEYRMYCGNGEIKWILARGRVIDRSRDGKPLRMAGLQSDVTAIKLMQSRLSETDNNLQALLRDMTDGVIVSRDERCVFANHALLRMLDCDEADIRESTCESWIDPDSMSQWQELCNSIRLNSGAHSTLHHELQMRRKGGGAIWVDVVASTLSFDGCESTMALIRDISQRKDAEATIWRQANYDALTGLPNRQFFTQKLEIAQQRACIDDQGLVLMFIDLDNFKEINDTLGHEYGDRVLKALAQRLRNSVRDSDLAARLGGDEFTLLIPELTQRDKIEALAQKIHRNISQPLEIGDNRHYLSASIGIVLFPDDADSAEQMLQYADQAMYAAKRLGRGNYSFFSPTMQQISLTRSELLADLRRAVALNEFQLLYQPIINLKTGVIEKAEALLRWNHPVKGMISPLDFIPIAEESGLILPIGEWTFKEALRQSRWWRDQFGLNIQVSVNKSPMQFQASDSRHLDILGVIEQAGVPDSGLVVEITEGLLLEPSQAVLERLARMRELGIEISIDDFGTGYSSLSYLKKFDIDYLKIDRSFVLDLENDPHNQALCEAIIVMAHKLNMRVVAEGVETQAQRVFCARPGAIMARAICFPGPSARKCLKCCC